MGTWRIAESSGTQFVSRDLGRWTRDSIAGWHNVLIGDLNGDGKADIAGQNSNGQWFWIHQEVDRDVFSKSLSRWMPAEKYQSVFAADLNRDGTDELIGRRGTNGVWRVDELDAAGTVLSTDSGFAHKPDWDEKVD